MTDIFYLIYLVSFVLGSVVGLLLSYKKYGAPFVTEKIDAIALIIAIVGWILLINNQLLMIIPFYVSITIGVFMAAMVLGMRPGYGRYETVIGIVVSAVLWLATNMLL
ncbi:energy-converting hydrogenase subunit EhaL family protein [Methanobacterium alcaliphilum]|uniref:energy-converting hydrogenase subunit EhaL family protein n=1 Tax=Methanobacterium alcaliphilum TaxID=392018 RepID=UPI00200B3641|nr:DUF2104 domain-containing protein [Methanobacterium alcaliphilum]